MATPQTELDASVLDIINGLSGFYVLHPAVANMSEDLKFKDMFWKCMSFDLQVISLRSQDLAHHEITAAQKAFKFLMDSNETVAAIRIYVDSILGLDSASETQKEQTMATALETKDYLMSQVYGPIVPMSSQIIPNILNASPIASAQHRPVHTRIKHSDDESLFISDGVGDQASDSGNGAAKLTPLLDVYEQAKRDFDATLPKSLERTQAAKFLRDTIENCLNYVSTFKCSSGGVLPRTFSGVVIGDRLMDELEINLKNTIQIVERGSGGKKRRFEHKSNGLAQRPPNVKMQHPIRAGPTPNVNHRPHRMAQLERQRSASPARTQPVPFNRALNRSFPTADTYRPLYR